MDENMHPEVGDKVRVHLPTSEFHSREGIVHIVRDYDHPKLALVVFDDEAGRYFRLSALNVIHSKGEFE